MDDVPRRHKIDCWTPAELAIGLAMETVEKMAADVRLTDAILLLAAAKHSVADYLEGVNTRRHVASDLDGAFQLGRQASWDDARASVTQLQSEVTSLKAKLESALSQVCGACGHPWTGEKCGQADNDHPFQTCYPVAAVNPLAAECETLRAMVYVPGLWRCPKCEFQSLQSNLNASDGSITVRDQPGDKCPNCDVPLWRVSEREAGNRMVDRMEKVAANNAELRADIARANEQNELTHKAYVDENTRVMGEREVFRAELAAAHAGDMPWDRVELRGWSIVGMNHYRVAGVRNLFVAMTKDGMCITAEGPGERWVWKDLARKAYRVPDAGPATA